MYYSHTFYYGHIGLDKNDVLHEHLATVGL